MVNSKGASHPRGYKLSSHMRKLEEAKLIKVQKQFVERKPKTTYTATTRGALELKNYLAQIQNVIEKVEE